MSTFHKKIKGTQTVAGQVPRPREPGRKKAGIQPTGKFDQDEYAEVENDDESDDGSGSDATDDQQMPFSTDEDTTDRERNELSAKIGGRFARTNDDDDDQNQDDDDNENQDDDNEKEGDDDDDMSGLDSSASSQVLVHWSGRGAPSAPIAFVLGGELIHFLCYINWALTDMNTVSFWFVLAILLS